jgi:hypothetical protein
MKFTKSKKTWSPLMYTILYYRRAFLISLVICAAISIGASYTFRLESYSYSTILGIASGLGVAAALWLTHSIFRLK